MALTPAAAELTTLQRQRQLALRAAILRELVDMWPAFDINRIDASFEGLRPAILSLIAEGREGSQALAAAYFAEFRQLEGIATAPPTIGVLGGNWRQRALVSLEVTGPLAAKNLVNRGRLDAAQVALTRVSGVVGRLTLESGTETVLGLTREDELALGWARVTDGMPCAFCAMLASRGPVYKTRQTAGFDAHDHCACTVEPVYHRNGDWPGRAREFLDQWNDAVRGVHGTKASLNAFRRAYESA